MFHFIFPTYNPTLYFLLYNPTYISYYRQCVLTPITHTKMQSPLTRRRFLTFINTFMSSSGDYETYIFPRWLRELLFKIYRKGVCLHLPAVKLRNGWSSTTTQISVILLATGRVRYSEGRVVFRGEILVHTSRGWILVLTFREILVHTSRETFWLYFERFKFIYFERDTVVRLETDTQESEPHSI